MKFISKFKSDPSMTIGLALAGLGLLQAALSNKAKNYERESLKADLRKELMEDLGRSSN